jgi:hypothetical protein
MHLGCCSTFGKRKKFSPAARVFSALSESLATSLVHGSRNPARKTIRYSFSLSGRPRIYNDLCIYVVTCTGSLLLSLSLIGERISRSGYCPIDIGDPRYLYGFDVLIREDAKCSADANVKVALLNYLKTLGRGPTKD